MDGLCSSTCTTFADMFHQVASVKLIAVGGRPEYGPMQAIGGVRGAQEYGVFDLGADIARAVAGAPQMASLLPSNKTYLNVTGGSFNLRDQIRQNESFPLQFAYEPADCRIFFTPDTFNNYTNLWLYAANVMWGNGSCVQGSTGVSASYGNGTDANGTSPTGPSPTGGLSSSSTPSGIATGSASKIGGMTMALVAGVAVLLL